MCSNMKEYVKSFFQGITSIILCKRYVSTDFKDNVIK